MRNIVIIGASKGLGNSIAEGLKNDKLFLVSRTRPKRLNFKTDPTKIWIQADLSDITNSVDIKKTIGPTAIDALIYNAGIWETKPFEKLTMQEINNIVTVNLTSALLLTQKLLPNIRKGKTKKIIFMGSTCGLENEGNDSVVYTASKFGLRGLTHSLREYVRKDMIAVTCISPGSIASDISLSSGTDVALDKHSGKRIPASDIMAIINMILDASYASCIKEIHIPALNDTDA